MILRELAQRLGCTLRGDGAVEVHRVAGIEDSGPGDLTFVANRKYAACLATTRASAVILAPTVETPDRKSTRLNSSHFVPSRMPSSA